MGKLAHQDLDSKLKICESIDSVIREASKRIVAGDFTPDSAAREISALAELVSARAMLN